MKFVPGILMVSLLALGSPSLAQPSNVAVVKKYTSLIKRGDYRPAEVLMTPKIVWVNQNFPGGREAVAGAYTLYLATSDMLVGVIEKVSCQPVDDSEVSCSFKRRSMFGGDVVLLTERYFVTDGKIIKIANTIPPELSRLGQSESAK